MARSTSDDAPTAAVVWAAAARIGKADSREELERICDYLVNKNWFQTAGDLRAARQAAGDWQALEVPARLKIAIQQVLDENSPDDHSACYYGGHDREATAGGAAVDAHAAGQDSQQWWTYAAAPAAEVSGDAAPSYLSEHYYYCYDPASADYSALELGGGYTAETEASDASDAGSRGGAAEHEEVVEAEAVVVEDGQVASGEETWSCGQCTFANASSEAFCLMCMGHVSLSPSYARAGLALVPAESTRTEDGGDAGDGDASPSVGWTAAAVEMPVVAPPAPLVAPATRSPAGIGGLLSPSYAPSAPELEQDEGVGGDAATALGAVASVHSAGREEVRGAGRSETPRVDFLALAFQRKARVEGGAPAAKALDTRREEATEYV